MSGFYVVSRYHPDGAFDRDPGARARRAPATSSSRPTARRSAAGMTRAVRLPARGRTARTVQLGPFAVDVACWSTTPCRPTRCASRPTTHVAGLLRRHRPVRGAGRPRRGRRPVPVRGVVRRVGRQPARPAPDRRRGGRSTRPGPAVGRLLVTHIPTWTDRDEVEADVRTTWDGPYELVTAGRARALTVAPRSGRSEAGR